MRDFIIFDLLLLLSLQFFLRHQIAFAMRWHSLLFVFSSVIEVLSSSLELISSISHGIKYKVGREP